MKRLCWNAIVKNEEGRILRAAASALPHITCAVIHDTGSTDGTPDILVKLFAEANIPFKITHGEFRDFAYARNAALQAAWSSGFDFDYLLLFDADMELRVSDAAWTDHLDAASYLMFQHVGALWYQNARLLRADQRCVYLSPTHEYLDTPPDHCIPREQAFFEDYADGANRPDKFKRDIKLLKAALKDEPNNARYMYYLAQSYRDAGNPEKAAKWYKRRVKAGGWEEEKWHAQYMYAHCLLQMGDEAGYIEQTLAAYNMRPTRTEPLYDLANWYRIKGWNAPAAMIAEAALQTPPSGDPLFVNEYVTEVGSKGEFAISGFYLPWQRTKAFKINNWLSLYKGPYRDVPETARQNMFFYAPPLKEFCPSFEWKPLKGFDPPDHYIAMNPSIACHAWHGGPERMAAIIRTVNYRINEHGQYLIRATDGTANNTNPIHTRNFLVYLDDELNIQPATVSEIMPPGDWPVNYPYVIGAEDMRLYHQEYEMWASATVRQISPEGFARQYRMHLAPYQTIGSDAWVEMTPQTNYEKNWMPVNNGKHWFAYRLNEIVDGDGKPVVKTDVPIDVGALSGGTQLVWTGKAWVGMVHEARYIPDKPVRYYLHRFVAFNEEFKLMGVSLPFYFNEKGIEYAAGLCLHPDGQRLVISYGFKDAEARFATVQLAEVERLLLVS